MHGLGQLCFDPETPVNIPASSNTVLKDAKKVGVQVAGIANVGAMAGTTKKIKDIKVGDKVFARDDKTGKTVIAKVKQVFVRTSDHLINVALADKSGRIVETLKTTRQHPFYVDGKGWVPAGGLGIGNAIVTRAGPRLFVKSIKWNRRPEGYTVYNFEVEALSGKAIDGENTHSYFVGNIAGGAWVHNGRYKAEDLVRDHFGKLEQILAKRGSQWGLSALTGNPAAKKEQALRFAKIIEAAANGAETYEAQYRPGKTRLFLINGDDTIVAHLDGTFESFWKPTAKQLGHYRDGLYLYKLK